MDCKKKDTRHIVNQYIDSFWRTCRDALWSILIILALMVIVSFTAQGGTLVIDLLSKPIQAVWAILLSNFLALCLSHFPVYIAEYRRKGSKKAWRMVAQSVIAGFGLIFYVTDNTKKVADGESEIDIDQSEKIENRYRRWIGVFFYITWLIGLLTVYKSYYNPNLKIGLIGILISIIFALIYSYLEKFKDEVKANRSWLLKSSAQEQSDKNSNLYSLLCKSRLVFWVYILLLALICVGLVILLFIGDEYKWSRASWGIFFGVSSLSCVTYLFFRNLRSLFYIFFGLSRKWDFRKGEYGHVFKYKELYYEKIATEETQKYPSLPYWMIPFLWIRNLSNNIAYIKWISIFGRLNAFILFGITFMYLLIGSVSFMSYFNPLIIVMAWILFYYTLVVILTKHFLFYRDRNVNKCKDDKKVYNIEAPSFFRRLRTKEFEEYVIKTKGNSIYQPHKVLFTKYIPLFLFSFLAIALYTNSKGNDRHLILTQSIIPEDVYSSRRDDVKLKLNALATEGAYRDSLNFLDTFLVDFQASLDSLDTIATISTYGGGLKANAWTLLVMDSLLKANDKLLSKTLSISGVSGGSIGMANFYSMLATQPSKDSIIHRIDGIGLSNTLSHEIHYILSWDLLANILPTNYKAGLDRSYYSMRENARISYGERNSKSVENKIPSFPKFWRDLYKNHKAPPFFANTKSTSFYYGMTSPFYDMKELGAAIDVVHAMNIEDNGLDSLTIGSSFSSSIKTPNFYDAVSPSNRFPLASPAARIKGKGHFVDGGYFDNSGLMTTMNFLKESHNKGLSKRHKVKHILIVTGKSQYIQHLIEDGIHVPGSKPTSLRKYETLGIEENSAEYKSILTALLNLDGLPYALEDYLGDEVYKIYLPHKVYPEDIEAKYKGMVDIDSTFEKALEWHNGEIDTALRDYFPYKLCKWGVVEPPLSRLLSEPGYQYQKAMLSEHRIVKAQIAKALDGL